MNIDKPIIFIGFPRSGTSIISEIIFQHEQLAWPSNYQDRYPNSTFINKIRTLLDNSLWRLHGQKPQLNKVSWYNRYVFKPAEAYNFWENITDESINFSTGFLLNVKTKKEGIQKIRAHFEKLVSLQNRKRLAFKITGPGRISYLHSIFPDAIFIEISREPFAAIRSLMKVPFWQDKNNRLYWEGAYTKDEIREANQFLDEPALLAAIQYKKIKHTIKEEQKQTGSDYHIFSYEDFISNPRVIINAILKVVDLQKSKLIDDYLMKNKIFNQNNKAEEFFDQDIRRKMKELLK